MRPLEDWAVSEEPRFESPLFQSARWPRGCVVCGAEPVRLDDLTMHTLNTAGLLVGRVGVSSGTATGVPHCAEHRDGIRLEIRQDRTLRLKWHSLGMLRCYLAANRSR